MDKKKKINTLNDPIAKASRKIMKGIGKAGDFEKSSVTKGFKSYMGTKGIHLTNANVSGIQNGKGKSRKSIMPGLTRRIKEVVQGGDSTKVANYTKWLNSFGGTPTNHPMSDYEHSMRLKEKKKNKNKKK